MLCVQIVPLASNELHYFKARVATRTLSRVLYLYIFNSSEHFFPTELCFLLQGHQGLLGLQGLPGPTGPPGEKGKSLVS